jgi:D-mannonate dehydratase
MRSRSPSPSAFGSDAFNHSPEHFKAMVETKRILRSLFDHYALHGNRMSNDNLKSQKFCRMLSDAGLIDCDIPPTQITGFKRKSTIDEIKKRFDLIFCSVNRNKANMDFAHFLQAVVKVAEFKYPDMSSAQALKAVLDNHFIPLACRILEQKQDVKSM